MWEVSARQGGYQAGLAEFVFDDLTDPQRHRTIIVARPTADLFEPLGWEPHRYRRRQPGRPAPRAPWGTRFSGLAQKTYSSSGVMNVSVFDSRGSSALRRSAAGGRFYSAKCATKNYRITMHWLSGAVTQCPYGSVLSWMRRSLWRCPELVLSQEGGRGHGAYFTRLDLPTGLPVLIKEIDSLLKYMQTTAK